jgi:hypothetical protein
MASLPEDISLQSLLPAAFPEVTGYRIYRNNLNIETVPPIPGRFIDNIPSVETFYQVSALYGDNEGQRSDPVSFVPVDCRLIEQIEIRIYPTIFTNQVGLIGCEYVNKIEAYTADGTLSLRIDNPGSTISTESLSPGVYFFRIYTSHNGTFHVMRGVKRR